MNNSIEELHRKTEANLQAERTALGEQMRRDREKERAKLYDSADELELSDIELIDIVVEAGYTRKQAIARLARFNSAAAIGETMP